MLNTDSQQNRTHISILESLLMREGFKMKKIIAWLLSCVLLCMGGFTAFAVASDSLTDSPEYG